MSTLFGSKHVAITYQDRMAVCRRRRNCVHLPNSKCTCRTLVVQQYNTDRGQALRLPSLHAGHPRDHPPRITAFAPYNRQTPPQLLPYHVPLLSNCDRQDAMRCSSIQCAVCHGDLSKGAGPATWRTAAAPAAATRPVAAPTAPTAPHQRPPLQALREPRGPRTGALPCALRCVVILFAQPATNSS